METLDDLMVADAATMGSTDKEYAGQQRHGTRCSEYTWLLISTCKVLHQWDYYVDVK